MVLKLQKLAAFTIFEKCKQITSMEHTERLLFCLSAFIALNVWTENEILFCFRMQISILPRSERLPR